MARMAIVAAGGNKKEAKRKMVEDGGGGGGGGPAEPHDDGGGNIQVKGRGRTTLLPAGQKSCKLQSSWATLWNFKNKVNKM